MHSTEPAFLLFPSNIPKIDHEVLPQSYMISGFSDECVPRCAFDYKDKTGRNSLINMGQQVRVDVALNTQVFVARPSASSSSLSLYALPSSPQGVSGALKALISWGIYKVTTSSQQYDSDRWQHSGNVNRARNDKDANQYIQWETLVCSQSRGCEWPPFLVLNWIYFEDSASAVAFYAILLS